MYIIVPNGKFSNPKFLWLLCSKQAAALLSILSLYATQPDQWTLFAESANPWKKQQQQKTG